MPGFATSFPLMAAVTDYILYVHCTDVLAYVCAHKSMFMKIRNERILLLHATG